MAQYALIINNEFIEIRSYESKPEDIPHKNVAWYDVVYEQGETAFTGIENGNWVIRTALPTLDELKQAKISELAAKRWQVETSGTIFNGMSLATDTVSQIKYVGAVVGVQMDPSNTLKWKMADGSFVELDATAITAIAMAVRTHIQACFDKEADLKVLVEAAISKEELDAIDIYTGWPA